MWNDETPTSGDAWWGFRRLCAVHHCAQLKCGIFGIMEDLALKLLELQAEFQSHEIADSYASEFNQPEWASRPKTEIATEYSATLAKFIAVARV